MAADPSANPAAPRADKLSDHGPPKSNWKQIRWMIGLGLEHPVRCAVVLGLQLALLGLALSGLSLAGLAFDVIAHALKAREGDLGVPPPVGPFGLRPPAEWTAHYTIVVIAGAIVALAALQAVIRFAAAVSQARLINTIMAELRATVYDKLQRLSFRFFDANETGAIINRATGDVSAIANFAEWAIIQTVVLAITLAVNLVYMSSIHTRLTLVALATTPVLAWISISFSKRVRPALEEARRLLDRVVLTLSENIQGQHVVKGFARQPHEIAKFHKANDDLRQQQRWYFRRVALYNSVVWSLTQVNLLIVLLYGGWLVIGEIRRHAADPTYVADITVGNLIVFAALLQQFSNQVVAMANMANTLQRSLTSAGRVKEVLDAPLEVASAPDAVPLPRARGRVQFEHVTFGYNPADPVLHDVNFEVEPGQCVAVLGATGSGKSTLLSLVPRFYDPTRGRVLIDGIDARKITLDDLRRNIGLVFQESFLFSNTVASNISFGHPDATREQIERAAKIAAAHDFIMDLPQGYDTVIGEQGSNLSGGQRQRLAIARAILLEPAILILDDATAAIDPETEHEILQAMDNAMKGRTTFVVAHRLSTLRRADFIVVLDHGRVVQTGTHEELMAASGQYADVAHLQVADAESRLILQARRWYDGEIPTLLDMGDLL